MKSFWIGTAIGGVVGAALGLLFAPKAGKELRRDAAEAVRRAGDDARKTADRAMDWAAGVKDRLRDVWGRPAGEASPPSDGIGDDRSPVGSTVG